ncbi:MAG: hypothetical protein IPJ69_09705 [Deltaproteobacteria bacterium]|nr:MAG: hypothetical protein IPJ69_09705 [Deltaproteobacteria bacterium]
MVFRKLFILSIFFVSLLALEQKAWSYNFLYINPTTGAPIGWEPGTTIHYYVDPGSLGRLTNEQARTLIRAAMDIWENASPYANTPRFVYEGLLPEDVDGTNFRNYVNLGECYTNDLTSCESTAQRDLKTVIIFDQDDSILRGYLCPTGCLGQSRAGVINGTLTSPLSIAQGMVVLSGAYASSSSTRVYSIVSLMTHELGHLLGLAHTSVNQQIIEGDIRGYDRYIPTMYYYSVKTSNLNFPQSQMTLNPDDVAGITTIYPLASARLNTGTIQGDIFQSDNSAMKDVNVIVRNTEDSLCEAVSFLSGRICPHGLRAINGLVQGVCYNGDIYTPTGNYTISSLLPGAYTTEVEEVSNDNLAGSLGLIDPFILGDAEFWNDGDSVDESNTLSSNINLPVGRARDSINIILNRSAVTSDRIRSIPLSMFTVGTGTRCPISPPIDYAALVGITESAGSAGASGNTSTSSSGCSLLP